MSDSLAPSIGAVSTRAVDRAELPQSYSLDNAAIVMPAVSDDVSTTLFRLSVDLDAPVDRERLQTALDRTAARFPYLAVELARGAFWYRFVPLRSPLCVEDDPQVPCVDYDVNVPGTPMFRVRSKDRRIALEMSHIVADGKGGMRFLKTLVAEYCRLSGHPALEPHPDVYDLDERPDPEEWEDAYVGACRQGLPVPTLPRRAFRLPSALLPKGSYRVTTARYPLPAALSYAKSRGVTLTELVAAVYVWALQERWMAAPPRARRDSTIAVEIPIDMRRFFPSKTNRNFSLFAIVGEDLRLGTRSFDNILERVKLRFRLETDEPSIAPFLARNVNGMFNPIVRAMPLFLKDLGAKVVFRILGEDYVSGVVSNLGAVDFPKGVAEHIVRFDLAQPPAASTKVNVALHSFGGELYVTIGSLAEDEEMEGLILGRLADLGLEGMIECNLDECGFAHRAR